MTQPLTMDITWISPGIKQSMGDPANISHPFPCKLLPVPDGVYSTLLGVGSTTTINHSYF
jgi:hypothetical protein